MSWSLRVFLWAAILLACVNAGCHDTALPNCGTDFTDPHMKLGRTTMVHMFEYRWTDIQSECENWLGPLGFGGVQVSPPTEHRWEKKDGYWPWWLRYQPVSFEPERLVSRSGDRQEFIDMVDACNKAGVRVYVDVVINHLTGGGKAKSNMGRDFDGDNLIWPEFSHWDINECNGCPAGCEIANYGNAWEVRNCRLVGLRDLQIWEPYPFGKIKDYLNDLIGIGVAGFRVDAAKHMWPDHLKNIYNQLDDLNTQYFDPGSKPFITQEVIDHGGEAISVCEYVCPAMSTAVTEFAYGAEMSKMIRRDGQYDLQWIPNGAGFGETWYHNGRALLNRFYALVFIDNHDNQRGHGGGNDVLTAAGPNKDDYNYKKAVATMLAWPYGTARLMASYKFDNDKEGPPSDNEGTTYNIHITGTVCDVNGDWICEYRWRQIRNMVWFRNVVYGLPFTRQLENQAHQTAFSFGNNGFFAINNHWSNNFNFQLHTGLSPGVYCDVVSGDLRADGTCSGRTVTVGSDDRAWINIPANDADPMIAIHAAAKQGYRRTIVYIEKDAGGGTLDIRGSSGSYFSYAEGPQSSLTWSGHPLEWTTNQGSESKYDPLNNECYYGPHNWKFDVWMDCTVNGGTFEMKGFCHNGCGGETWQSGSNRIAKCGKLTQFGWTGTTPLDERDIPPSVHPHLV